MALNREVINAFIALTETIANSQANTLDFGEDGLVFHRGEIHIIKMIGDYPGIFSSEIARRFGITRAVIHKTLLKIEERGLVTREQDDRDRKKHKLYLTGKGQAAYRLHEEYHNTHDKALFEYVNALAEGQLKAIKGFLEHACRLIRNHA